MRLNLRPNTSLHPFFCYQLYAYALGLPSARILLDSSSSFRDQLRQNELRLVEHFHTGWTFRLLGGAVLLGTAPVGGEAKFELDEVESFFDALNMLQQRTTE